MRRLLVLWDPANPLVPVASVVEALQSLANLRVMVLTYAEVSHPSLPNGSFDLHPLVADREPDGILWIEGGPFPSDLSSFQCPKACWLINSHLEPSLLDEVGSRFDHIFSANLRDTAEERARWLAVSAGNRDVESAPAGISLLVDDPRPPVHGEIEQILVDAAQGFALSPIPLVLALGNGGRVHPMLFDCLRVGAAVVADPDSDLRGIAHVGEHLDIFPSRQALAGYLRDLLNDPERIARLAARGPAIVDHLHQPGMRAIEICRGLWPDHRVLSGTQSCPRVSILVTCYRYLRRFRVCLESLARQDLPAGSLEIVVADPGSPDGLAVALGEFAHQYPGIRLVHLPLDPRYHRNRGVGINRAFDVCQAPVVIAIDGDLVFPPRLVGTLEQRVMSAPDRVFGVRRSFIGREETERILKGELDPFANFEKLCKSTGDGEEKPFVGVLGYCQAVNRRAFARARYPEEFDVVNQSDIVFVERLGREAGVTPQYLHDETVLHLWHPRNWKGTGESL